MWQFWYSKALNSSYLYLKSLQLQKVPVESKYFRLILSCAIDCVKKIQYKRICIPTYLFVHLLKLISEVIPELLLGFKDLDDVVLATLPYFNHCSVEIQLVAIYIGHLLVPMVQSNSPVTASQLFALSVNNIHSILQVCGYWMPTSCCLKLLLSFSILPENCSLLLKEGVPLFCLSIVVLSQQIAEKQIAFSLLRRLIVSTSVNSPLLRIQEYQWLDPVFVTESLISKLMSLTCDEEDTLQLMLQEIKKAGRIQKNRQLFQKCGLLECLGLQLETCSHSEALCTDIADLICVLLSDEQELTVASEVSLQDTNIDKGNPEQVRDQTSAALGLNDLQLLCGEAQTLSENVKLHAQCLNGLLNITRDEFRFVLSNNKHVVRISSLVDAVDLLRKICILYECESIGITDKNIWEKQLVFASTSYLPKLFYISFRALESIYSDAVPGIDKLAYEKVLREFLAYLHFAIETWSRMSKIQLTIIKNGTCYLLFNELHTYTTTHLLNEDILYAVLTSLYNILLNSNHSQYFRELIKYRLLQPFFGVRNLKYLAKCSFGCLQSILSKRELDLLEMNKEEVNLLSRCLKKESSFFGGYEQLVLVISNLAKFPRNWNTFVKGGIVNTLISLSITESGKVKEHALRALLNMTPEPDVTDSTSRQLQRSSSCLVEPLTNSATEIMRSSTSFMQLVQAYHKQNEDLSKELCHGINLLISPLTLLDVDVQDHHNVLVLLERLGRWYDSWRLCQCLLSLSQAGTNRNEILFHKAISLSRIYSSELPAMLEMSNAIPGYQYKTILRTFCQKRVLEVVRILTTLVKQYKQSSQETQSYGKDRLSSILLMLDKALLDSLVFNVPEIGTCLLCHTSVRRGKLTRSHYIPKSIIQEFVKLLGAKPGDPLFYFLSVGKYPSDWQRKSAGQIVYSMLCQTCDGEILSKDENTFKVEFFDKVYSKADATSLRSSHSLVCNQYLVRFTAGLFFRSVAPRYSQVSTDIGDCKQLYCMMQMCRAIVLESTGMELHQGDPSFNMFLFALPTTMPKNVATPGWDQFVKKVLSPYMSYELLKPGTPMLPTRISCCMVKIGVLLFVMPFNSDLEKQLIDFNPFSLIKTKSSKPIYIPREEIRMACIPEKIWWSLAGWAKKVIESQLSMTLSADKLKETQSTNEKSLELFSSEMPCSNSLPLAPKHDSSLPVVVDMLPPGFSLNFDKYNTLPDEVIKLPPNHIVLLHQQCRTNTGAEFFIVLAKLQSYGADIRDKTGFSWPNKPCVLVYLHQQGVQYRSVLKTGFYISDSDCCVLSPLPGASLKLLESPNEIIQDIIRDVPKLVRLTLQRGGFNSLGALLFWSESLQNLNNSHVRISCTLDTRCRQESCNYCDMRCDCCMKSHLEFHQTKTVNHLTVQSCSKECSETLFRIVKNLSFKRVEESKDGSFAPKGHAEIYRGSFSTVNFPGINSIVMFSICKSEEEEANHYCFPQGITYIKFWQRCVTAPNFIVYTIDGKFNALEEMSFKKLSSDGLPDSKNDLMYMVHNILLKFEIPLKILNT